MATRVCSGCGEERDCEADFYSGKGRRDGKRSPCKKCTNARNRPREAALRERRLAGLDPQHDFTCIRCHSVFHRPTNAGSKKLCNTCSAEGRICGRCKQFKTNDRFYQFNTKTKGSRYCLDGCFRDADRERRYGLAPGTIESVLERFGNKCGICGATESSGRKKELHVDHDHATGEIRGLLCNHCNMGIGHFKDDVSLLREAIRYLA